MSPDKPTIAEHGQAKSLGILKEAGISTASIVKVDKSKIIQDYMLHRDPG